MIVLGMVFSWVSHIIWTSLCSIQFDILKHHALGVENFGLFGQLIPTQSKWRGFQGTLGQGAAFLEIRTLLPRESLGAGFGREGIVHVRAVRKSRPDVLVQQGWGCFKGAYFFPSQRLAWASEVVGCCRCKTIFWGCEQKIDGFLALSTVALWQSHARGWQEDPYWIQGLYS